MKKANPKALFDRIKQVRIQHSGDRGKSRFARELGISPSTYNYYENNRIPPVDVLIKIAKLTGVDLQWLLTGEYAKQPQFSNENQPLMAKIDNILKNSPDLAEAIYAFVELLGQKKGLESSLDYKTDKTKRPGWIPVLGRTAAGIVHCWNEEILPESEKAVTELDNLVKEHSGKEILASKYGNISIDLQAKNLVDGINNNRVNLIQVSGEKDQQIVEFVQCSEIYNLFPDTFALHIDGDSMAPRINDGDIVLLSPSVPAPQGHIAIARIANQIGVTCKLIRSTESDVHLIAINEKYESKVIPKKELLWALAVLCHLRT